jgi:hypothetical protein
MLQLSKPRILEIGTWTIIIELKLNNVFQQINLEQNVYYFKSLCKIV